MTKNHFKAEFSKMVLAYNKEVPTPLLKIYWDNFKGLADSEFSMIVNSAIATSEFFPTVSRLNNVMERFLDLIPSEADVMNDLRKALKDYGIYQTPVFEYPITNALAEEIGWHNICNSSDSDMTEKIHFRYTRVAEELSHCVRTGKKFAINRIKGLFEETGTPIQLPSGNIGYISRNSGAEIRELREHLPGEHDEG